MAANPVENASTKHGTAPISDEEKDISTTHHEHSQSPHHEGQSVVPVDAPIYGAAGLVGESSEKADHAAASFKNHPVESNTSIKHENEGSTATNEKLTKPTVEVKTGEDGEEPDNTVYPGGLQLILLTFGLWYVFVSNFSLLIGAPRTVYSGNSSSKFDLDTHGGFGIIFSLAMADFIFLNSMATFVVALVRGSPNEPPSTANQIL